jgi:hypothetical protein
MWSWLLQFMFFECAIREAVHCQLIMFIWLGCTNSQHPIRSCRTTWIKSFFAITDEVRGRHRYHDPFNWKLRIGVAGGKLWYWWLEIPPSVIDCWGHYDFWGILWIWVEGWSPRYGPLGGTGADADSFIAREPIRECPDEVSLKPPHIWGGQYSGIIPDTISACSLLAMRGLCWQEGGGDVGRV